eukprot:11541576-Ditylum_brightwellii.AAC.1
MRMYVSPIAVVNWFCKTVPIAVHNMYALASSSHCLIQSAFSIGNSNRSPSGGSIPGIGGQLKVCPINI